MGVPDQARDQRLHDVACIAVPLEASSGCPARMLIAQWALESQWGSKPVGHANYFGIKYDPKRHTRYAVVTTEEWFTEQQIAAWDQAHPESPAQKTGKTEGFLINVLLDDRFADYDSLEAACQDYAWLITEGAPYRAAWESYLATRDADALMAAVAKSYATAPSYALLVREIAGQANVTVAIAAAGRAWTS